MHSIFLRTDDKAAADLVMSIASVAVERGDLAEVFCVIDESASERYIVTLEFDSGPDATASEFMADARRWRTLMALVDTHAPIGGNVLWRS